MAADNEENNFIIGGYEFLTESDAQKASMDISKIRVLESRTANCKPSDLKAVYEKAIENRIFKTPIGWEYLRGLRKRLIDAGYNEEDLLPIPLGISVSRRSALEGLTVAQRIKPEKKGNPEFKRVFPIVLSAVLFLMVIFMFVVALIGENDNILNYKRNITNRYAGWEQDLTERERAVRAAEKRLGIEDNSEYFNETETDSE
ncbi:MAG: hypothetical protein K6G10_08655 [Butyrivibrio sp.]|nr:hypothetical protein [Butyrivibrio sp.]